MRAAASPSTQTTAERPAPPRRRDRLSPLVRLLAVDGLLAACVLGFIVFPPVGLAGAALQAAAIALVLMRLGGAWHDWRHPPVRLNRVWHAVGTRGGRRAGRDLLDRIARTYALETDPPAPPDPPFDGVLGEALLHARQDLPVRLGCEAAPCALDAVAAAVHAYWIPVDRSASLPSPGLRMAVLDPLPDATGFASGFDALCHARARAILAEDREIAVFWSGGIDSTAALAALLQQASPADRARLHVFLRPRSIREYPLFFERHVSALPHRIIAGPEASGFRHGPARTFSSDVGAVLAAEAASRLVVTGEHGDQIFGSIALAENPDWIGAPAERLLDRPEYRPWRADIERLNAACPVPVETIDTLLWWWNFAVKWQEISFRSLSDLQDPAAFANIRHFFRTPDFERWSIANPDLKIRDSLESYKWPAKDFIYRFTRDADYRDHKLKVGSLRVRIGAPLAVDTNWNVIRAGRTSTDEARIRARYGEGLRKFVATERD